MNEEKQIDEMAVMFAKQNCMKCGCEKCKYDKEDCEEYDFYRRMAEAFYSEGYRKASNVVNEVFDGVDGITDLFAKGIIGELEMYDMLSDLKKKCRKDVENAGCSEKTKSLKSIVIRTACGDRVAVSPIECYRADCENNIDGRYCKCY